MTRDKKEKSKKNRLTNDLTSPRTDNTGREKGGPSHETASRWTVGKTWFLYALTAAIVGLVFVPWLNRYIQGQFFGLTGDYGTDFYRYSQGSVGRIRRRIDPYSNEKMFRAIQEGRLRSDHPNPYYDEQMAKKGFGPSSAPIAKGVVSPPFLLVLIYPLVQLCGYTLALNLWMVAGLLGVSWLSILFWRKLIPQAPMWRQVASHGAMLSLLVLASFPVLWSAIYGQFDVIYFVAMGGAIYLWVFHRGNRLSAPVIGLLLAIGGAVKIFPLVLLGYFFWKAICSVRLSHGGTSSRQPTRRMSLVTLPEMKVVFWSIGFLIAINLLTGLTLGFDAYPAFFRKLADLQVEGTGPSMKGNLFSYLNFAPVWLNGPFTPMTADWGFLYVAIAAMTVAAIALTLRAKGRHSVHDQTDSESVSRREQLVVVLEMTLVLAALPTVLPHWWTYYNVILILPLMACVAAAREITKRPVRYCIVALTAMSFALTFSYLTTSVFFGAFPKVYNLMINREAVDIALEIASAQPEMLENLPYSGALGEPLVPEFEGRVVSVFNLLYGYPGTVMLLIANSLALRSLRGERSSKIETTEKRPTANASNPFTPMLAANLVGGMLLSLAGGYAIVWEGQRRLSLAPEVAFFTKEHLIESPHRYVNQRLGEMGKTASDESGSNVGGLVVDILPPNHFIEVVSQSDPALAGALLRQDRSFFEDGAATEKLVRLFADYQVEVNSHYLAYFENGQALEGLSWRYQGHSGGIIEVLETTCRQRLIRLRRVDLSWRQWQLRFLCEYTWQKALESLSRGQVVEFAKLVYEHRIALSGHQAIFDKRFRQLKTSVLHRQQSKEWQVGFVYIQEPAFTALSSWDACRNISQETPVETVVHLGLLYVAEELLRRARLAKNGDPYEALSFARRKVALMDRAMMVRLWPKRTGVSSAPLNAVKEILQNLSRNGLFHTNEVNSEGVLTWDESLIQDSPSSDGS